MTESNGERKSRFSSLSVLLLCLVACGLYYHFFFNRSYVALEIEVEHGSDFKLYWSGSNEPFSEERRAIVRLHPDKSSYSFFLADLDRIERLRVDPAHYSGDILLNGITIRQPGYRDINLDLGRLEALNNVGETSLDNEGLHIKSTGNDPNFLVVPEIRKTSVDWVSELFRYLLICLVVIFLARACSVLQDNFTYIPVMLAMIFVLIVSMAAISKRNAHPDEYVHLDATIYYQDNWLPPAIDDKSIEHTYSVYGVSRLNNGEIYYLLAGKFTRLVSAFNINELFSLRSFNLFLFGCILLYAIGSIPARLMALPFLLSPQIWYLFSYCGSDAFGLFLCFIAGCELVRPRSFVNRLIDSRNGRGVLFPALVTAITLALLLLLKINYYPFVLLFYLCVGWRIVRTWEAGTRRRVFIRITAVTLLALVLAGLRVGTNYFVNGFDRQEKMVMMQEKMAHHWYKPSTELHQKHVSMYLRDRGTTLKELIEDFKWFERSFITGVGMYGYFTIAGSETYYELMKWLSGILLIYIFLTIIIRGSTENRVLAILTAGLALALIGASLHRSWTIDLQAQGRYIFPVLPMLGILLAKSRALFSTGIFTLLVGCLFGLSAFSFIFIALVSIPRPL